MTAQLMFIDEASRKTMWRVSMERRENALYESMI